MTLDAWLQHATAGLPPEVAERVRTEYAAHVAESGLPEAEAVAALGQPGAVRRALGRTYLSGDRLQTLRDGPGLGLFQALAWGGPLLYGLMLALIYADAPAFPWWRLAAPTLTLLLTALLWGLTRRLPAERRTLWRTSWGSLGIQFMLWVGGTLDFFSGAGFVWPWFLPLFALLLLGALLSTLLEDRRIRRTLALTGGRP